MISKVDRLVLELKLPPADAYLKIKHTLEEINGIIMQAAHHLPEPDRFRVSPLLGNVAFASGKYGFSFTLSSFAKKYSNQYKISNEIFKNFLWGDIYYNKKLNKF